VTGSQENHFKVAVLLMLFFFVMAYTSEALLAFKLVSVDILGETSKNGYLLFSGIAIGMLRGMQPDQAPGPPADPTNRPPADPNRLPPQQPDHVKS
jgi:hypothetical protein